MFVISQLLKPNSHHLFNYIYNYKITGMLSENYAIDIKQLRSFISRVTDKKLDEVLIEDFNSSYQLDIDILSPQSLYQAAENIEKKIKKQISFEPQLKKDQLINFWHLGEKNLLFCTLIYFLNLKRISIQSITEKDLLPLKKIFITKDISLLLFQAKHLLCKTHFAKNQWSEEGIPIFRQIMASKQDEFLRNEKCFRWKEVSYELFRQTDHAEFHSAKDCRQKWMNHFSPRLVKATWSLKEDIELFAAINEIGCRWSLISKNMGRQRTEHMIKNRANSLIKRYLKKKVRRIEAQHISFVLEALQEERCVQDNIKQEAVPLSSWIKKQESENIFLEFQDQVKLEMEICADDRNRQMNTLEVQENSDRKIKMEDVKEQFPWNEEGHFFNYFEANKLNESPDLEHKSQS